MICFPNCKINIGLRVTGRRADGYHDLETIFFPVAWHDALEIIPAAALSLHLSGNAIPGNPDSNLCLKAWHMLKTDFPGLPPVSVYLHKTIPAGAGLGGGSSNGAFMLKLLNDSFDLQIPEAQLMAYALRLGSDCPFFLKNRPVLAKGRGEQMEDIDLDPGGHFLALVNPGIHVPTGWAFGQLHPAPPDESLRHLISKPVHLWEQAGIQNDFEAPVLAHYPEIAVVKQQLVNAGALFAAMTGTGSTVFGIFAEKPSLSAADFPAHYMFRLLSL